MYFDSDPFTGFKLKPHGTGYFHDGIQATANSNGHRDNEVSMLRTPGVFRILLLGDSFTVGASVAQDEAYPQVLERMLNNDNTRHIEIINAAVGGWGPFQYAQYYEHYGREFDPDAIILGFFVGNDTYDQTNDVRQLLTAVMGRRVTRQAAAKEYIGVKIFLYEHSHIVRLLMNKKVFVGQHITRVSCQDFSERYIAMQRRRITNHLKRDVHSYQDCLNSLSQIHRIKTMADNENIPLIVALLPDENQINPHLPKILITKDELIRYDFDMPQSMLTEILTHNQIPVIDLLPGFRNDNRCLYMNDTHWTAEGHELAATVIYEELVKRNLIRNQSASTGEVAGTLSAQHN